jgi:hypothetical protein
MDLGVWRRPGGTLRAYRCWQCGVAPQDLIEVRQFGGRTSFIPNWPPGDHRHAEEPPTPEQLLEQGAAALLRILNP